MVPFQIETITVTKRFTSPTVGFRNDLARFSFPEDEFRNDQETIACYTASMSSNIEAATIHIVTNLDTPTAELLRAIQETMEPESLSIVLFDRSAGEPGSGAREHRTTDS